MAKADAITLEEFNLIHDQLIHLSNTWADLWLCISHINIRVGRIITLKYIDIVEKQSGSGFVIFGNTEIPFQAMYVINRRKKLNPDDEYIFQSHSGRVGRKSKPVTIIAFNQAINIVSSRVTDKNISSTSALRITNYNLKEN